MSLMRSADDNGPVLPYKFIAAHGAALIDDLTVTIDKGEIRPSVNQEIRSKLRLIVKVDARSDYRDSPHQLNFTLTTCTPRQDAPCNGRPCNASTCPGVRSEYCVLRDVKPGEVVSFVRLYGDEVTVTNNTTRDTQQKTALFNISPTTRGSKLFIKFCITKSGGWLDTLQIQPDEEGAKLLLKETSWFANLRLTEPTKVPVSNREEDIRTSGRKLIPLLDRVLVHITSLDVESDPNEKQSAGQTMSGTVISVGSGGRNFEGKMIPLSVREGDKVLVQQEFGLKADIDQKGYYLFRESEILAKWSE